MSYTQTNPKYDFLIVGAGLYGTVFAIQMKNIGIKCLVIDKRGHIGGNIFCRDIKGTKLHKYDSHIFHTKHKEIWGFVNYFVEFNSFTYSPLANYNGSLYNLPFNMNTFYQMWGVQTPQEASDIIEKQKALYAGLPLKIYRNRHLVWLGKIYTSKVMRDWFSMVLPREKKLEMILDGDLPKKDMFLKPCTKPLSENDGGIHTVVPGRPIGIEPEDIGVLAKNNIHFHFYGNSFHRMWSDWIEKVKKMAGDNFHIHPNCPPDRWVEEFSQYDAGWLHTFESQNEGDLFRVGWNDMNIPARLTTLALSGVPVIQRNNTGHIVETQSIAKNTT